MNAATEDRRKIIAAAILTSLALFLMMRWLFPAEPAVSASGMTEVRTRTDSLVQTKSQKNRNRTQEKFLDPLLQIAKLGLSENTIYDGSGRNIFAEYGEESAINKREKEKEPEPDPIRRNGQSIESVAPPLRLRFFGFATRHEWPQKVFLYQDGDVFIGSVGDVVNRRYKLVRVGTTSIDVEDLIENRVHTLPLAPG